MKTIKEYRNIYLTCDVLLLTDIFEKFKIACLIAPYLSGAALIWDEILKMTVVKVELISDVDIYQFVERRISGDFFTYL